VSLSDGGLGSSAPSLRNKNQNTGGGILVILVVASIVLFTVSVRGGETGVLGTVRSGFQTITSPVRYAGAVVASPFQGLANIFTNLTVDQATLSELQAENDELQTRNAELEEAEQTATRLQGLLDLKDTYNLQSTAAHVISGSTDSWTSTVTIDKGTSSGIAVGMPVTATSGVIGQVIGCGATTSTVRLVTDESSSISAMIQTSRAQGMLTGSATGQLALTLISTSQTVEVGDIVVTSGLGGVFPKGLPLGKVTSVENNPGSLYLDIIVEPFSTYGSYEEVLVITSLTEGQQASSDDIAAADAQDTASATSSSTAATAASSSSSSSTTDGTATTATGTTE